MSSNFWSGSGTSWNSGSNWTPISNYPGDDAINWTPDYSKPKDGGFDPGFGWGENDWDPVGEYPGSGSGGYKSKWGELTNIWDKVQQGRSGTSSSGDFKQAPATAGAAGGHSVSPLGNKSKSFLMQYIHPTATIIPGAGGVAGGGGGGGSRGGGFGGAVSGAAQGFLMSGGNPVGALVGGIGGLFCDERLKVDIAPLESTEVNDALAEVAFFVKGLRECA